MEDWSAEAQEIYDEFEKEGFEIYVRVKGSRGTFNPDTLEYEGATDDSDNKTYGLKKSYDMRMIDGTIVQQNDTRLFFPSLNLPELGTETKIVIDSEEVNVVRLKKVDPGNVTLLYEAQIRE